MVVSNKTVSKASRFNMSTLLAVVVLGLSVAILLPASVVCAADQSSSLNLVSASDNQPLIQITCSLSSGSGAGNFTTGGFPSGGFPSGGFPSGGFPSGFPAGGDFNFTPGGSMPSGGFPAGGDFNFTPGMGGSGALGGGRTRVMNTSLYSDISSIANVVAVVPILQVSEGQNQTSTASSGFTIPAVNYMITGVPLDSLIIGNYPVLPTNITAGRNLQGGDSGTVLLSENNSAYFGAGVGDTVTILGTTFAVVGIHGTSGIADNAVLYMSLSDAQSITNNTGYASRLEVFVPSSADANEVVSAISSLHPELSVVTAQNSTGSSPSLNPTQTSDQSTVSSQSADSTYLYAIAGVALCVVIIVAVLAVRKRQKPTTFETKGNRAFQMVKTHFTWSSCRRKLQFTDGKCLSCEKVVNFKRRPSASAVSVIVKYGLSFGVAL